ncbi:MAG: DUF5691 domain-containing protein [Mycobacteriales bacterium]
MSARGDWTELVGAVLVGTDRRPVRTGGDDLLAEAAEAALERYAGWLPPPAGGQPPDPAPEDPRPRVPDAAGRRLRRMLAGEHDELLPEWLAVARGTGRRAPEEDLPDLLDHGRAHPTRRTAVAELAGPRGRWLAGLNPRWRYAAEVADPDGDEPVEESWRLGSRTQRAALLVALRGRDPAAARDLLASTWSTETAEDRAAFLQALATGLSAADEEFCEAALDDRGRQVREVAADLLARLPDSALAGRMAERAQARVRRDGRRLAVILPTECDEAMRRDGVLPNPRIGTGERAWWLEQIVAATPLDRWPAALGQPLERLVTLRAPDDLHEVVRRGWVRAAVRQGRVDWAYALLGVRPEPDLLAVLPHDECCSYVAGQLDRHGFTSDNMALLPRCPDRWTTGLGRAFLAAVERDVTRAADRPFWLGHVVAGARLALPLELAADAERLAHAVPGGTPAAAACAELAEVVEFRAQMHQELEERQETR